MALLGYQGDRGNGGAATALIVGHADLAQPLFEAGIPASRRRGNLEVIIARQNYYQAATERLYQARVQFLQILARQQSAAVLRDIQAALVANQDVQDELIRAGLASRMTQLQARVQRLGIEPDLSEANGAMRRGIVTLRQLMGRETGKPDPEPRGSLAFQEVRLDLRALTAEALQKRPDIAALRGLISASEEDQRIVQAGYYPLIEARVGVTGVPPANKASASANPNALRSIDSNFVNEFRYGVFLAWVIDNGAIYGQSKAHRGADRQPAHRAFAGGGRCAAGSGAPACRHDGQFPAAGVVCGGRHVRRRNFAHRERPGPRGHRRRRSPFPTRKARCSTRGSGR